MEAPGQTALKIGALQALLDDGSPRALALWSWFNTLPVTGRVNVGSPDPRWLQVNPSEDPSLQLGDSVTVPSRPVTVTVLGADGARCRVRHEPGLFAADYVQACWTASATVAIRSARPAHAWIAQPDGRTFQAGMAAWALNGQAEPAPGAWIVPHTAAAEAGWAERATRFLATQGPAPDDETNTPTLEVRQSPSAWVGSRAPRDPSITASDWGEIGLLQTPTARLGEAGTFRFHWSRVWPYSRGTLMLQPFDWLEGGIRYSDVDNRLYLAGYTDQSYKDKSIDFKIRLLEEGAWWPQLSLGMRDLGGTGQFSGEYLVGSKRHGDLDFSLGLGWGYLGARGTFRNPLSALGKGFDQRTNDVGQGGTVATGSLFRGRTALFGGVQWHTPWKNVWLKAEIEGNDYKSEPQNNNQPQSTPVNVGVVWRPVPGVDLALGWERGQELMFSLTLEPQLSRLSAPKTMDPPLPRRTAAVKDLPRSAESIAKAIEAQTGWQVNRIADDAPTLHVHFSDAPGVYRQRALERIAHVLDALLPPQFERFVLHFGQRSLVALNQYVVGRKAWSLRQGQALPPSASPEAVKAAATGSIASGGQTLWEAPRGRPRAWLSPNFGYILGGPDAFLLYQIGAAVQAQWPLSDSTWVSGTAAARVLDNYDKFKWPSDSLLPRVRTYQREYVTTRRLTMPKLQLSHLGQLSATQSYLFYGGWLEPMFAGLGGEWMWRPPRSPLALGLDINRVRQRAFEQDFALRDYAMTTGHLTAYWNTGWQGLGVKASVGQYLAGDRGATIELSRTFENGVIMGAYATKTNVSAALFGEGSFDKGIFISLPTDAILPRTTNRYFNVAWSPLTRDGGAKLHRSENLHRLTRLADSDAFRFVEAAPPSRMKTGERWFEP